MNVSSSAAMCTKLLAEFVIQGDHGKSKKMYCQMHACCCTCRLNVVKILSIEWVGVSISIVLQ